MSVHRKGNGYCVKWRDGEHQHSKQFDHKEDADACDAAIRRLRQVRGADEAVPGTTLAWQAVLAGAEAEVRAFGVVL